MHGASEQCMHATEIDFSPGTPSFSVTTRRRFTPHGMSCSLLQAVTHPLHSMQRSASHRNFILAMAELLSSRCLLCRFADLAQRGFSFLHHGDDVVAVGRRRIDGFAAHDGCCALRVLVEQVLAHVPALSLIHISEPTRLLSIS